MAWHIDVWHDPFTRDMALWRVVCEGRRDVCAPTYRLECMQHASFICSHDSFIRISICIHTYTCTQETSQINVIHKEHSVPWNLIVWLFKKSKKNFKKSSTKQSKNFLIILEGVWGSLPPKQGKHNRNLHIKAGRSHTRISHRYVTASFVSDMFLTHLQVTCHSFISDMRMRYVRDTRSVRFNGPHERQDSSTYATWLPDLWQYWAIATCGLCHYSHYCHYW